MRQALAGMLWSKQYFSYDVNKWFQEHGVDPLRPTRQVRNREWFHMISDHVISMPDKWEYPWFAAWDLAFHTIALATVDVDFAKQQLDLLLVGLFLHPTGQIPAYEWNFSDVNPPVHGWATIFLYRTEQALRGKTDLDFLKRVFGKLASNFGWWVNRKDRDGRNLYEGGFLGLDTSAFSTAARRCRLAAIWSRPMVPRRDRTLDEDYSGILAGSGAKGHRPINYFRSFYNDTAVGGASSAIRCALYFFGAGRCYFWYPLLLRFRRWPDVYPRTIAAIDGLTLTEDERASIYFCNALRMPKRNSGKCCSD